MSHHYFVNKFLQEISIIIILISYLNFHGSKSTRFAIIYYQFIIKKVCDGLNEIYQHLVYKSYKAWFNTCKKHLLTVTSCRCFDLAIYTDLFTLINNIASLYDFESSQFFLLWVTSAKLLPLTILYFLSFCSWKYII